MASFLFRRIPLLILLITGIHILTPSLLAGPLDSSQANVLREKFQTRQQQTKTWSANFIQTVSMPGMRKPVVSNGHLSYRAPDQLRLEFTEPKSELALVLEDRLFMQKAGKKVNEKSLSGDNAGKPFQSLLGLLRGRPMEEESFYTIEVSRHEGYIHVTLTRKEGASRRMPERIDNKIDAASMDVRQVVVEMSNGGSIAYEFDQIVRNQSLPDSLFAAPSNL